MNMYKSENDFDINFKKMFVFRYVLNLYEPDICISCDLYLLWTNVRI